MRRRKRKFAAPLSFKRLGDSLTRWTERWIPDALVIVIILSFVAYVFALIWGFKPEVAFGTGRTSPSWPGSGLLESARVRDADVPHHDDGYILACSPPVRKLMDGVSGLSNPEKPYQAIVVMSLFSMILAWLNWGLSLIASAMLALFIVRRNPSGLPPACRRRLPWIGLHLHAGLSVPQPCSWRPLRTS